MTAIEFENISKQYRLGLVSTGTLSHDLNRFWQTKILRREDPYLKVGEVNDRAHKGASEYVWALKDINFKVEQGDVVGIIGRNGAGKSTLLKLLSRVTAPTTGTIRARGRIASLLEVGTGFHPEMTGRENIYMNGAIMGMSRAEITRKLDEIVDFSGCERYLDTPVKRYSSGMTVRLGFAIAAHLEPEILVVDEVLAVGDAEFQKKAIGKMQDVSHSEGRTVLFVSHNMGAVKNLCKRGIVLNQGQVAFDGGVEDAVRRYINTGAAESTFTPTNNIVRKITARQIHESIEIQLDYSAPFEIKSPCLGIVFYDSDGAMIFGTNPDIENERNYVSQKEGSVIAVIKQPLLTNGLYHISIWFHDVAKNDQHLFVGEKCLALNISDMLQNRIRKDTSKLGPIIPDVGYRFI